MSVRPLLPPLLPSLLFAATTLVAGAAWSGVSSSPHNLRNNTKYPNAAALASGSSCGLCHEPRSPGLLRNSFGNDFPNGLPVITDPYYAITTASGTITRRAPSLPGAMTCLQCHDGVMRTKTGDETMVADPNVNGPNLYWGAGGAHNVWGGGWSGARHPVEIHYPPLPEEKMNEGFNTLTVAGDNNVAQDADGNWYIYDTLQQPSSAGLPLVTDPADPTKAYITCTTCHDVHGPTNQYGPIPGMLRGGGVGMCMMCHRQ